MLLFSGVSCGRWFFVVVVFCCVFFFCHVFFVVVVFCCVAFVVRFVFCGPCCCVFPRLWVLFPLVLVLLVFLMLCVLVGWVCFA